MKPRGIIGLLAILWAVMALVGMPAAAVHAAGITYYSQGSVAPNLTTSWNTSRGGGGSQPANFTSGDVFVVQDGHNMTTSGTWSVSGAGSRLWIEGGGALTATSAVTLASATTFRIDAGGTYIHNNTTAYGSSIFQGIESFAPASTVILNNSNTTGPSSVAFGNLIVNFTGAPSGSVNCSGGITTINGNLTVQSTSSVEFRLTASTNYTLDLRGNLDISGGALNLASGTAAPAINIGGSFKQTGGTLTSSGGVAAVVFAGGSSASVTFDKSAGTLTNTNINWQIAAGKTVALNANFGAGSWVASGRAMTVNGTFQLNEGAWPGSNGAWIYGPGAALVFNTGSSPYGPTDNSHVYWPAANSPSLVAVQHGATVVLPGDATPRRAGTVNNTGALAQTIAVGTGSGSFLAVLDPAGASTTYYGVDIAGGADIGSTLVRISGDTTCADWAAAGTQPTVLRCYVIDQGAAAAVARDVTFYYQFGELNNQDPAVLWVWWYDGDAWQKITAGLSRGACSAGMLNCSVTVSALSLPAGATEYVLSGASPTAVTLESFQAAADPAGRAIEVTWQTAQEMNSRGFNLWRGTLPAGPDIKLNAAIIPSQAPGGALGAGYAYTDTFDLLAGTTYYYWLEDVSLDGALARHEPVTVTYTGPTAVTLRSLRAGPAAGTEVTARAVMSIVAALALSGIGAAGPRRCRARATVGW
jgi:hypothetical protein